MARPKSSTPIKIKLSLTVTPEMREMLNTLSDYHGKSISTLLHEWAVRENDKMKETLAREAGNNNGERPAE